MLILPCVCILLYMSSYYYVCVLLLQYVSAYYYMRPHTAICDLILLYMCPHTTIKVSSYYNAMHLCPHTTRFVSSNMFPYIFYSSHSEMSHRYVCAFQKKLKKIKKQREKKIWF